MADFNGIYLDNGVMLQNTESWLKLAVPKTTKALKERKLKAPVGKSDVYTVPKSDLFAYAKAKLADGSVLTVMRYRPILDTDRLAMYEQGIKAGLKVEKPVFKDKGIQVIADADDAPSMGIDDLK